MRKIKLITDSCSSIDENLKNELGIDVIPMSFIMNNMLMNPFNLGMDIEEFYNKLEDHPNIATSCIAPQTYYDYFEKYIGEYDIIYISLSAGLSASYNNAFIAKNMILEEYQNAKVEIIDSVSGSYGMLFAINACLKLIEDGQTIEEIKARIDKNKLNVESDFTIGSLYHLYKGGRLKLTTAMIGGVLRIKPIVSCNKSGVLEQESVHIGKKKAINELLKRVIERINPSDKRVFITYTNNKDEYESLKEKLLASDPELIIKSAHIDPTLGCHCGPKTLAVFFRKK